MTTDALMGFHPVVANWFRTCFDTPTEIQEHAWPAIQARKHALIAAPTGSGKTLAAFLSTIDDLVRLGLEQPLPDETQVVYVSPLKALSNDIERNLREPLRGIRAGLQRAGEQDVDIRVLVRTGDTTPSARAAMVRRPPHILVTTPESLYLLLTSDGGRGMLGTVHTVIVDEIHAMVGDKRGAHLALSLERLCELTGRSPVRIGLSATQNPIELVARFLTGSASPPCAIVDVGHRRHMDVAVEVPRSPLTAVMPTEVWDEVYERLEELIAAHRTTLIFVNTRRLAERMAHNLTERLGPEVVAAHHGSMSKEKRLDAESRLKGGTLRALVATASLELGIDIGSVDLVCQIGSAKSIAAFLQRIGRSGHTVGGTPKGRVFPLTRNELVECAATLDAVRRGELDRVIIPEKPLDILAQQIVAEVSARDYTEDDLFALCRRAYPYRHLERNAFDEVVRMLAQGFTNRNGRRRAYLHHDIVGGRLRGRRGARLTALTSGGAIPDNFDVDVILEPTNTFIGTVNEDFAIESMAGDIFQLGNNSWRILRIESGRVRVEDARGLVPTIPFWFGEAPGRTTELSVAVSRLRQEISRRLDMQAATVAKPGEATSGDEWKVPAVEWLESEIGLPAAAADQLVSYLAAGEAALGFMPAHDRLVIERFFDEAGDMHVVLHSPYGSRVNRAWGLALRKRFCRKFNFELQAAANEDAIILSLGATHSFPLEEVFRYLSPGSVRAVLIQALLDSPMFEVRWRWNASRALAVLRRRGGKRVPPAIQRMQSEDLIALVFPDQLACLENIVGERELPDHPLVSETVGDCLHEAMDIDTLERILGRIEDGTIRTTAVDLREPSPLSEDILNARPYAFLDDAPLEERRANAVKNRRWLDPAEAADLGRLDQSAIDRVRDEAWPAVRDADELHDALVLCGCLTSREGQRGDGTDEWLATFDELVMRGRAATLTLPSGAELWVAAERLGEMRAIHPRALVRPAVDLPARLMGETSPEVALREIVRGRLEALGPVRAPELASSLGVPESSIDGALAGLENEGFVLRGHFTPDLGELEWCERRLLARIHRYTMKRLRSEIEPVSSADYMRFLIAWHHLDRPDKPEGPEALRDVLAALEGFEAPAAAWEGDILPARMNDYDFRWLDTLSMAGRFVWGRLGAPRSTGKRNGPMKSTLISIMSRAALSAWLAPAMDDEATDDRSHAALTVRRMLDERGALFFDEIVSGTDLLKTQVEDALRELVAAGAVTSDGFTGLRALLVRTRYRGGRRRRRPIEFELEQSGRWSLLIGGLTGIDREDTEVEQVARALLRRYGAVFRKLAERESLCPPWRTLVRVLRRLEARGEVRGGRFVDGVWGEQFALAEAVASLRKTRTSPREGQLVSVSGADPVNLTGIVTPGRRVASLYSNRILYRDGVPIAMKEGGDVRFLAELGEGAWDAQNALVRRNVSPRLRAYLGKGIG